MAEHKLSPEQRETLTQWLAADYSERLIRHWFEERQWPELTRQAFHYHRKKLSDQIEALRAERHTKALTTGLAVKEERVERLKQHADRLEEIKWLPDDKGKLHNEKSWRETLDDIAKEVGHRRTGVDLSVGRMSDDDLITEARRALNAEAESGTGGAGPAWNPDTAGSDEPDRTIPA